MALHKEKEAQRRGGWLESRRAGPRGGGASPNQAEGGAVEPSSSSSGTRPVYEYQASKDERHFEVYDSSDGEEDQTKNRVDPHSDASPEHSLANSPIMKRQYRQTIRRQLNKQRPNMEKGPSILKRLTETSSEGSVSHSLDSWESSDYLSNISEERDNILNASRPVDVDSIHQEIAEQRLFECQLIEENMQQRLDRSSNSDSGLGGKEDYSHNRQHLLTSEQRSISSPVQSRRSHSSDYQSSAKEASSNGFQHAALPKKGKPFSEMDNNIKRKHQRRRTESTASLAKAQKAAKNDPKLSRLEAHDLDMFASE